MIDLLQILTRYETTRRTTLGSQRSILWIGHDWCDDLLHWPSDLFWGGVLGFLKALIWPVFFVLEALRFFGA